jgi:hypothetical protein
MSGRERTETASHWERGLGMEDAPKTLGLFVGLLIVLVVLGHVFSQVEAASLAIRFAASGSGARYSSFSHCP